MKRAAAVLALFVAGCSSIGSYQPYIVEVTDPMALAWNKEVCAKYAQDYPRRFSPIAIASAGAKGALTNLPQAAVSPLATGLGGIGNASGEAVSELGLSNTAQVKIYLICLKAKCEQSRGCLVLDPNL